MTRLRPTTILGGLRALALAGTALAGLVGPAWAQDAGDPDNPVLNRNARRGFGLDTGANGLPALRGANRPGSPAGAGAFGNPAASASGDASGGDPTTGLSGAGEGLSRLPRFRTGGGQSISSLSGTTVRTTTSLLRQRAAPPRRFGVPTRVLTRSRTQQFVTDLRLSPVIQNPVSGVPLPASVPLAIPSLGLVNPGSFLLSNAFSRQPDDADPAYAPLGIKVGTFTLRPAFTQSIGYDTNPDQTVPNAAKGSVVLRSEGELNFRSDWSSSELSGELRGGYSEFLQNDPASRPNAVGATRLRIDVNRDTRIDLEARLLVDTQRFGNPDLGGASVTSRPIFATYGVTAGVAENFNRLQVSLRGSIDRQVFEDATLTDGSTLIQSDRNTNQYGLRLRVGYEISPAITPFVEGVIDTRVYDTSVDAQGIRRDSDGIGFNAGARFELTRTLSGEFSAGLQHRDYVDRTLRAINAPIINTSLIWAASPLTTVRFSQATGIIETSIAGSSGVFTDVATVEVQHDLLRNLSITVGGSYISTDYQGVSIRERGFSALARADYRFNRWLTLRGSYIYQQIDSTAANSSYSGNIFLMGLRINP